MTDDQVCILSHKTDPDRLRRAWIGYFCRGHLDGFYRTLNELSGFAAQADEASYDEAVSIGHSQPTTGTKDKPLPINEQRADHVIQVRGVLASWTQMVAEERGVAVPNEPDPRTTSGFLRLHLDWVATQEWADEFGREVLHLGARAWSLLHPSRIYRSKPLGPCVEMVEDDNGQQVRCAGTLSAVLATEQDLFPAVIDCDTCFVEVTSGEWGQYARKRERIEREDREREAPQAAA